MSARTSHTPGPWIVDGQDSQGAYVAFNRLGDHALIRCADPAQERSNAALIAAAPETAAERDRLREERAELLAALRLIADAEYGTDTPKLRATARAAIAKAEGNTAA